MMSESGFLSVGGIGDPHGGPVLSSQRIVRPHEIFKPVKSGLPGKRRYRRIR
jgi:hypothetical protein